MPAFDRTESYSKIRRWLDRPLAQRPDPDQILSQMLVEESNLSLELTNSGQPWGMNSFDLATVANQSEYAIPASAGLDAGKAYFVVRSTGRAELPYVPVHYNDFRSLDYGQLAAPANGGYVATAIEQISFYRTGNQNQTLKAVISPTPQEVLNYKIYAFSGSFDRLQAAMNGSGIVKELTDYKDLKAAMALMPYAEWKKDAEFNMTRRKELMNGLGFQFNNLKPVVEEYILQINAPVTFEVGFWNDF